MIDWHRLFGIALTDFFAGSPFEVELETDLSVKQQLLDIVVLRRRPGEFEGRLPDGLDGLVEHNLLTYKSLREPLDAWAIDELVGHYVNYRKQVSPSSGSLLPEGSFRLFGVSTRVPEKLGAQVALSRRQSGVYTATWGAREISILVLSEVPEEDRNAIWNLFSGVPVKVASGASHYRGHTTEASRLMDRLFEYYELEGVAMPYTLEDFRRDAEREILERLPPEERLRGLTPEERLRGLPAEERVQGLSLEERLRGLSPEEIEEYLRKLGRPRDPGSEH